MAVDTINNPLPGSKPDSDVWFEELKTACDWASVLCLGAFGGSRNDGADKVIILLLQQESATKECVRGGLVSDTDEDWFSQRVRDYFVTLV